ncbi:MAG: lipopolysaccharide heptosyltransferase II [bacterium]
MKILLFCGNYIGDVLFTTPAIRAIREHYEDGCTSAMVGLGAREVLLHSPYIDEVLAYPEGPSYRAVPKLRDKKFDIAFLFQSTFGNALTALLAGIPRRVGIPSELNGVFLTERVPNVRSYAVDRFASLPENLGIPVRKRNMQIFTERRDEEYAESMLREGGVSPTDRVVAINPATTRPAKCWFPDRYARVADALLGKGYKVIITGGPEDIPLERKIVEMMNFSPISTSGKTTIKQLSALIRRCDLLIAGDTGTLHIAAAVGTPAVALFGATDPELAAPRGEKYITIYKNAFCSPCFRNQCKWRVRECMESIAVDEVLESAEKLLKTPMKSKP